MDLEYASGPQSGTRFVCSLLRISHSISQGRSDASFPIKYDTLDFFLFDIVFQTGLIFFKRLSLAGGIMRLRIR